MPRNFGDVIIAILVFCVAFLLIPTGVYTLLNGKPFGPAYTPMFVYVLDILIFGGVYLIMNDKVKYRNRETLEKIAGYMKKIREQKKLISSVKRGIERSNDETGFGLEELDAEIFELSKRVNEVTEEQKASIEDFLRDTKPAIIAEIKSRYEPAMDDLKAQYDLASDEQSKLSELIKTESLELSKKYESKLGKRNMNEESILALISYMNENKASTVAEAIAYEKSQKQEKKLTEKK